MFNLFDAFCAHTLTFFFMTSSFHTPPHTATGSQRIIWCLDRSFLLFRWCGKSMRWTQQHIHKSLCVWISISKKIKSLMERCWCLKHIFGFYNGSYDGVKQFLAKEKVTTLFMPRMPAARLLWKITAHYIKRWITFFSRFAKSLKTCFMTWTWTKKVFLRLSSTLHYLSSGGP